MRMATIRRIYQKDIARELKVSAHTVSNWVNGRQKPRLYIWQTQKLCELLDCTVHELPDDFGPQPIPED